MNSTRSWGCPSPSFHPLRPGDVRHTRGDPSKARRLLRWQGRVGFSEGLRHTVEWFRANTLHWLATGVPSGR